ncbi:hypothetical protein MARINON1_51068 [Marinobacter salarius]|nr:hypothetical protein MBHK15_130543 [Marinobacter salarius]VXB69330.1 hypothetical protein MARINON1_51068 [Marinobacter salarius]
MHVLFFLLSRQLLAVAGTTAIGDWSKPILRARFEHRAIRPFAAALIECHLYDHRVTTAE